MVLISEGRSQGARLLPCCKEIGISLRTYKRWKPLLEDRRLTAKRPLPANKLSQQEEEQILEICNQPAYASLPPAQIVPRLADLGVYLASESTFYRVLHKKTAAQLSGAGT